MTFPEGHTVNVIRDFLYNLSTAFNRLNVDKKQIFLNKFQVTAIHALLPLFLNIHNLNLPAMSVCISAGARSDPYGVSLLVGIALVIKPKNRTRR
ncbi:MAG: hypothetical protein HC836_30510 [Richelia sp. RM2_1_2]|nr:hypothetical protein [Richelia sp. RM2_1_2]